MTRVTQAIIGHERLFYDSLPSTNAFALDLVTKTNPKEGTVIFAYHQSEGRGQIGRRWHSEQGKNCCFSVILHPAIAARDQFKLNIAIALGIRSAVQDMLSEEIWLKWPNDIIVDNRKLGGILIQNIVKGNTIPVSVAGIGMNVNQTEFPADIPNPVSLSQLHGASLDLMEVLDAICLGLETQYARLLTGKPSGMMQDYEASLYGLGADRQFRRLKDNTSFEGRIAGVDESGHLLIDTEAGREAFTFREIQMIL